MKRWWLGFALGVAVLLAAVGWMTLTALRLERAEQQSRRQAFREESTRLALWRMDSMLTPLIAREAARAYAAYSAFYPAERAYDRAFGAVNRGDVIIPSPILGLSQPEIIVHFQSAPDGRLSSPQVPTGTLRPLAEQGFISAADIDRRAAALARLELLMPRTALLAALDRSPAPLAESTVERTAMACVTAGSQLTKLKSQHPPQTAAQGGSDAPAASADPERVAADGTRSGKELKARSQSYFNSTSKAQVEENGIGNQASPTALADQSMHPGDPALFAAQPTPKLPALADDGATQRLSQGSPTAPVAASVRLDDKLEPDEALSHGQGSDARSPAYLPNDSSAATTLNAEILRPLWVGDQLVLARRVTIDGRVYVQGCWLDWALIRKQLVDAVTDILPAAAIRPVPVAAGELPHQLAALPALLVPGDVLPDFHGPDGSALGPTLAAAWICVALAAGAGAALLAGALALSERRGAFVSAVTHELRTPLTTFRLYAELLAGGMVPDEAERRRYLDTLRIEADRLSHLVENVLAFARLERAPIRPTAPTALAAVLEAARERLADRARQAGLELRETHAPEALATLVSADPQAIERILFNLVDNACKYAAQGSEPAIELRTWTIRGGVAVGVRDHGPGLPADAARRLFVPFAKSAADAARTAPGVGLGLALSRRLARQLGGDLALDSAADAGLGLVLSLPAAGATRPATHGSD